MRSIERFDVERLLEEIVRAGVLAAAESFPSSTMPEMQMIRTSSIVLSLRTRWQTSMPLISGSITSSTTRSGRNSLIIMPAPKPLLTLRTSKRPSRCKLIDDQFDQILVVVDDQDLALAAVERVGRDAVVAHERVELIARNAAEAAARHAEALELAGIEATNDRLLTDLADLGGFAGGEHSFHALNHPSP